MIQGHPQAIRCRPVPSGAVRSRRQERRPLYVIRQGLHREGLAFFLRGFGAAMARAFAPWDSMGGSWNVRMEYG